MSGAFDSGPQTILVIQLGTKSTGPRHAVGITKALLEKNIPVTLLISKNFSETNSHLVDTNVLRVMSALNTYTNKFTLIGRILKVKALQNKFMEILNENKPTLIILPMQHFLDPFLFRCISKFKLDNEVVIVSFVHDGIAHPGDSRLLNWCLMRFTKYYSDLVVVMSNFVAQRIRSITKKPILKIALPVDLGIDSFQESGILGLRKQNQILFCGRLVKYKGLKRMSESWEFIQKEIPDANLVVAGEGKNRLIQGYFSELRNVQVINRFLTNAELDKLIQESRVVALPYDEASQSGIMTKAVMFKTWYVVTPLEGLIEQNMLLGGGSISEDMTSRAFAESILKILRHGEPGNQESNDKINWQSQLEIILDKVGEIINEPKRGY